MKQIHALIAAAFCAALALSGVAHAQSWPTKPVKFVLPSPPASSPDRYTRLLAEKLSQKWGVPVVVENKLLKLA